MEAERASLKRGLVFWIARELENTLEERLKERRLEASTIKEEEGMEE